MGIDFQYLSIQYFEASSAGQTVTSNHEPLLELLIQHVFVAKLMDWLAWQQGLI